MTDVRDSLRTALEQRLRAALHALGSPSPADLEGAVSIAADRAAVGTPADS